MNDTERLAKARHVATEFFRKNPDEGEYMVEIGDTEYHFMYWIDRVLLHDVRSTPCGGPPDYIPPRGV